MSAVIQQKWLKASNSLSLPNFHIQSSPLRKFDSGSVCVAKKGESESEVRLTLHLHRGARAGRRVQIIFITSNHFKGKENLGKIKVKRTQNTLKLTVIKHDLVMPSKSLKVGHCFKKNQTWLSEKRYLMLGTSQLLIGR